MAKQWTPPSDAGITENNKFVPPSDAVEVKKKGVSQSTLDQSNTSSERLSKTTTKPTASLSLKGDGTYTFPGQEGVVFEKKDNQWSRKEKDSYEFKPINKVERVNNLEKRAVSLDKYSFEEAPAPKVEQTKFQAAPKAAPKKPLTQTEKAAQTVFKQDFSALDLNSPEYIKRKAEQDKINNSIGNVDLNLVGMNEEDVVPKLKESIKDYPYLEVDESGVGYDEVLVRNKITGESKKISLDNWTGQRDNEESKILRGFLDAQMNSKEYTEAYQRVNNLRSQITDATPTDRIALTEKLVDAQAKLTEEKNKRAAYVRSDKYLSAAIYDKNAQENIKTDLAVTQLRTEDYKEKVNQYNEFSTNVNDSYAQGKISREDYYQNYVPKLKAEKDLLVQEQQKLRNDYLQIKTDQQSIDEVAGDTFAIEENRGNVLTGTVSAVLKGVESAARFGLEGISEEAGGAAEGSLQGVFQQLAPGSVSNMYTNSANRSTFEQIVFGLAESGGAAMTGIATGGPAGSLMGLYASSYTNMKDQMNTEAFKDVPEWQKILMSSVYGGTVGILEEIGLSKWFTKTPAGKGLTNWILKKVITELPKDATAEAIDLAVKKSFKTAVANGLIQVTSTGLVEGSTELSQEAADMVYKDVFNKLNGKEFFDKPNTWEGVFSRLGENFKLGFLGGAGMQSITQTTQTAKNAITMNQLNNIENLIENPNIKDIYKMNLKDQILSGEITSTQAKEQLQKLDELEATVNKIPNNVKAEDKYQAFQLLNEREDIQKEITGKDPALVSAQIERINAINEELKTISQNAVQKQTTSEVSVQPGAEVGGEVAQGESQAGSQVVAEEGIQEEKVTPVESIVKELENVDNTELKKQLGIDSNWDMLGESDFLSGNDPVLAYTQRKLPEWNRESQLGNINPESELTYDIVRGRFGSEDNKNVVTAKDEKGITVGIVELSSNGGIENIAVAPEFRKKGVSNKLIEVLKENNPKLDLSKTKLRSKGFEKAFSNKIIADAYQKAKQDGSNPSLVKAVDDLLAQQPSGKTGQLTTVETDQVAAYRAEEQAELLKAIPKIESYKVNGEIDKTLMPKTVLAKYNKIYNKYDKLISPLLETTEQAPKNLVTADNINDVIQKQTTPIGQKLAKSAKLVMKALPGSNIYLHETKEDFDQAVGGTTDGTERGAFIPSDGSIHINMQAALPHTLLHEAFHAVVLSKKLDNNTLNAWTDGLKGIVKDKVLLDRLNKLTKLYSAEEQSEEFISELGSIMGEAQKTLSTSGFQKFKVLINKIAAKAGLPPIFTAASTAQDAVDFINTVSGKLTRGEDLTQLEPYSVGEAASVKPNAPMKIKYQRKAEYDVDFVTNIPTKSLRDVVDKYDGKVFMIQSDATGVGYDSNGDPIYGGIGYIAIKENVDGKIGFASVDMTTAKTTISKMINRYGPNEKIAVLVMVQNPSSTVGNYYGGKYFGRGLIELQKQNKTNYKSIASSFVDFIESKQSVVDALNKNKTHQKLIELIKNPGKYDEVGFAQEFVKDTTFDVRREILKTLLPEKADIRTNKSTPYIKQSLKDLGFNRMAFLNEYGDNTLFTEEMYASDEGGLLAAGFEMTLPTSEGIDQFVSGIESKGIKHHLFNGKLPYTDESFLLDGLYPVNENFSEFAKSQMVFNEENLDKDQLKKIVQGKFPEDKSYDDKYTRVNSKNFVKREDRTYTHLTSPNKIKFKAELQETNPQYFKEQRPDVSTDIARGMGFTAEKGTKQEALAEKARTEGFTKRKKQLVAPNGKPSNLNDKQWEQVRTPAFKKWFGDWENDPKNASKVVDENGEPLMTYHGSAGGFDEFKEEYLGGATDTEISKMGFFFTNNENVAKTFQFISQEPNIDELREIVSSMSYDEMVEFNDAVMKTRHFRKGGEIMNEDDESYEDFLKDVENDSQPSNSYDSFGYMGKVVDFLKSKGIEFNPYTGGEMYKVFLNIRNPFEINADGELLDNSESISYDESKYDGVIVRNTLDSIPMSERDGGIESDVFITKNPTAIKSATENVGTFSAETPKIKFQKNEAIQKAKEKYDLSVKERGNTKEQGINSALEDLRKSDWYNKADDIQREESERELKKFFGQKIKSSPSINKITGVKPTKIQVDEAAALKSQLRLEARAARDAKTDLNTKRKQIAAFIRSLETKGTITAKQASALVKRASSLNLDNPVMIVRFENYAEKVFQRAEYQDLLTSAFKVRRLIRKAIKSENQAEVVGMAKLFSKIDPSLVDDIDNYIELAGNVLNAVRPSKEKGMDVALRQAANIETIAEYATVEIAKQEENRKRELMSEYKYLVDSGVLTEDLSVKEMQEIISLLTDPTAQFDPEADQKKLKFLQNRLASMEAVFRYMTANNINPFTGEEVVIEAKDADLIKRLLKMDLNEMSVRDAAKIVEAMDNFLMNNITSGLEAAVKSYEGAQNVKQLVAQGKKARKLKSYFSETIGEFFGEQMISLPLLFEKMFPGIKNAADIMQKMGLTDVINGSNKAVRQHNDLMTEYSKQDFYKEEGFMEAKNVYERGMLAFLKRNLTGTKTEIRDEFKRRAEIISQSIEALRENGTDKEKEMADLYQETYDKLGVAELDLDVIEARASKMNKDAVAWMINQWGKHYGELADVSLSVYNSILGSDTNYTPDRLKSLSAEDQGIDEALLNSGSGFMMSMDYTDKNKTGVLMEATRPKVLPNGRYISLDFDVNNFNSLKGALVDINTASAIRQVDGFINSKAFKKLISEAKDRKILTKRINTYIQKAKGKRTVTSDTIKDVERLTNFITGLGVGKALGGLDQPIKQTVPVMINTFINSNGNMTFVNADMNEAINRSGMPIANRGLEAQTTVQSIDRLLEKKGGFGAEAIKKIEDINQFWLKTLLAKPDVWVARSSFITYYLKDMKSKGENVKDIDWSIHEWNKDSAQYAQLMVDRQQNISDDKLAGDFLSSDDPTKRIARKVIMPFATFIMNQKARMHNDFLTLRSKDSRIEDRKSAAKSLAGLGAELAAYQLIGYGIKTLVYDSIANALVGDDEEEEKKDKSLLGLKLTAKQYSATKFPVKSIVGDILSPLPIFDELVTFGFDKLMERFPQISNEDIKKAVEEKNSILRLQGKDEMDDNAKTKFIDQLKSDNIYSVAFKNDNQAGRAYGMVGIAYDTYKELIDLSAMAYTGEFEDEYQGRVTNKYLPEEDRKILQNISVPLMILYSTGIAPKDLGTVARKVTNIVKKKGVTENQHEKDKEVKKQINRDLSEWEFELVKTRKKTDGIVDEINYVESKGGLDNKQGKEYVKLMDAFPSPSDDMIRDIQKGMTADEIIKRNME